VKRIPSLDGLRAISIVLVVLGHLGKSGHAPLIFKSYYTDLGVELFFVISGYLITTILLKEHQRTSTISLRDFYVRRAYRIFPAAFVFMSLAVAVYWSHFRWYNVVGGFLYLSNFDATRPWIFGQLWSLGVEEQFYVLWPSVLKRWYKQRTIILASVTLLAPVGQSVLYLLKVPGGNYGAWPGVASTLAVGCLLAIFSPVLPKIGPWAAVVMSSILILTPLFAANSASEMLLPARSGLNWVKFKCTPKEHSGKRCSS
jgi:peptidoglycan/LPS O-acetylase OafA/YrhL